jgi:hypothetical protein
MAIRTSVQENGDHILRVASRDEGRTWHTADVSEFDVEIVELPEDIIHLVEIASTIEGDPPTWLGTIRLAADTIPPHIKDKM